MQKSTSKAAGEDDCLVEDNSDDDFIPVALSSNVENMCFHSRRPLAGWNQFQVSVMLEIDKRLRMVPFPKKKNAARRTPGSLEARNDARSITVLFCRNYGDARCCDSRLRGR